MFTDPETQKSLENIPGKLEIQKLQTAKNKIHHAHMQFKGRN